MKNLMVVIVLFSGLFFTSCLNEDGVHVWDEKINPFEIIGILVWSANLSDGNIDDACTVRLSQDEEGFLSVSSDAFSTMKVEVLEQTEDEIVGEIDGKDRFYYSKVDGIVEFEVSEKSLSFKGLRK